GTTLTPTSGNPPSGGEEGCETTSAKSRRHSSGDRHTRQLQPPWHYRRKPYVLRPPAESAGRLLRLKSSRSRPSLMPCGSSCDREGSITDDRKPVGFRNDLSWSHKPGPLACVV